MGADLEWLSTPVTKLIELVLASSCRIQHCEFGTWVNGFWCCIWVRNIGSKWLDGAIYLGLLVESQCQGDFA